jgi:hypothetical protein
MPPTITEESQTTSKMDQTSSVSGTSRQDSLQISSGVSLGRSPKLNKKRKLAQSRRLRVKSDGELIEGESTTVEPEEVGYRCTMA